MGEKKIQISVLAMILLGACISEATPVEWPISSGGNGYYYEAVLVPETINWESAKTAAETAGGYLATLTSAEENIFVFNLIKDNTDFWQANPHSSNPDFIYWEGPWLGGFQPDGSPEPDGNWQWVTGEPFSYTNWAPGEPSPSHPDSDRLQFFGYGSITNPEWNDINHVEVVNGYIVEYVPEPATLLLFTIGSALIRRRL